MQMFEVGIQISLVVASEVEPKELKEKTNQV
jgi:hypothetical protein